MQQIMLCKKCKNPIEDNAAECEWCGYDIITKPKEIERNEAVDTEVTPETGDSGWVWIPLLVAIICFMIMIIIPLSLSK